MKSEFGQKTDYIGIKMNPNRVADEIRSEIIELPRDSVSNFESKKDFFRDVDTL